MRSDGGETKLWSLRSTGTAFEAGVLGWQQRTGAAISPLQP